MVNKTQGGNISNYLDEWRKLTSDPRVIAMVQGCRLEFEIIPQQTNVPSPIKFSEKDKALINAEITEFKQNGIISKCEHVEGEVISNIFCRPKKLGKVRIILDLSWLNTFLHYEHFKMETIFTSIDLISKGVYLASIDLSDAYFSVPIDVRDRKYLRFLWDKQLWQFNVLPQGLSPAPRYFTKLTKCVFADLRSKGIVVSGYIDDIIIVAQSKQHCKVGIAEVCNLFTRLGFTINREKSVLNPVTQLEHLGFYFDTNQMTICLTNKRKQDILECTKDILENAQSVRIRKVCRLIGLIVAAEPGVQHAFLHFRNLEREKSKALQVSKGNFDANMALTQTALTEIKWWRDNTLSTKKTLLMAKPAVHLYSDSSLSGWGAWREEHQSQGTWSTDEQTMHINVLELKAVLKGLQTLCDDCTDCHIQIHTDNTTTIAYIKNYGGTKSPQCDSVAADIWKWAICRKVWISAVFVPGKQNIRADALSRNTSSVTDWELDWEVFRKIEKIFGEVTVDLFASRENAKLEKFVSWKPEPQAWKIDAFSIQWSFGFYAFPPFSLLPRILKKIEQDRCKGILIAPCWPTQAWFPKLLWLLYLPPVLLPKKQNLLRHPAHQGAHPILHKMKLSAWPLSGVPSHSEEFRNRLRKSSSTHGEDLRSHNTSLTSRNGQIFVLDGAEIRLTPIGIYP